MRVLDLIGAVLLVSATVAPAFAADSMMAGDTMSMMKGGEVVSVMPDGHMGTMMMTDAKMMADMMKMAKPLDGCIILLTGKDGKVYMVKPTTKAEIAECEKMAM
jgi:hypothetical protein